jgi:NADP-dependent alcohol dehydrogenase
MISFRLRNPTEIAFGQGQIAALSELVDPGERVLLLYGGGSVARNGVLDQVTAALADREVVAFGGIEPNPVYETILEAAALGRRSGSQLVLGVGGGSVVDAAKFLAGVLALPDADPWDRLARDGTVRNALPVGAVLTLPATGSESNPVSVITHRGRRLKIPFANEYARPRFAVLDPATMRSLSRRQIENGVVDAFTHVLEQYMTMPVNAPLQHGYSEVILRTLAEAGPRLLAGDDEEARETVMWAANQALNGLIGAGVPQDWSTHMIGHAITALYGTDHARTLTMIMPAVMRYKEAAKRAMLARYGRNVWGVSASDDADAARLAIEHTERFFTAMGCPVRANDIDADAIVAHLEQAGQTALGERGDIHPASVREILSMAA